MVRTPSSCLQRRQCLQRLHGPFLLGAGGQGEAVDVDVLPGNARRGRRPATIFAGDGQTAPRHWRECPARPSSGPPPPRRTFCTAAKWPIQRPLFAVDRVDDGLAVVDMRKARASASGIGGVQLPAAGRSPPADPGHQPFQRGCLVNSGQSRVDIEDLRPGLGLRHRLGAGVRAVPPPAAPAAAAFCRWG